MGTLPTLGGNLPRDEDYNGLPSIEKSLVDPLHAGDVRYAVVKFRTGKVVRKVADNDIYPVLQITHFEPITTQSGEDAAAELLIKHYRDRTGNQGLPVSDEDQPTLDLPEGDDDIDDDEV